MTSVVEPEGAEGWNFMGGLVEKSITREVSYFKNLSNLRAVHKLRSQKEGGR